MQQLTTSKRCRQHFISGENLIQIEASKFPNTISTKEFLCLVFQLSTSGILSSFVWWMHNNFKMEKTSYTEKTSQPFPNNNKKPPAKLTQDNYTIKSNNLIDLMSILTLLMTISSFSQALHLNHETLGIIRSFTQCKLENNKRLEKIYGSNGTLFSRIQSHWLQ